MVSRRPVSAVAVQQNPVSLGVKTELSMVDRSVSTSLISTAARHGLKDIVGDVLETGLDQVVTDGLLRDIPVINTVANLLKVGVSVSEELFFRKLTRFLGELEKVPLEEREKLLLRYPEGSEAQAELGERLLLLLEKMDQVQKPVILARFFTAFVREQVDLQTFSRLSVALSRFNLDLLPSLIWQYQREGDPVDFTEDFHHEHALSGLLTVRLAGSGAFRGSAQYTHNEIGRLFLEIGFGVQSKWYNGP
jgi:hypothetical protein